MTLRIAYNTNGCANHRLDDAIALIADAGYDGIALTLDFQHLDPYAPGWEREAERIGNELARRNMGAVIETGARFLLDPAVKHEPTLISPDPDARMRRVDFLGRAIRIAAIMRAEAMSFWAGVPRPGVDPAEAWSWLRDGVEQVTALAEAERVTAALEPEPGMLVETVDDYDRLIRTLGEGGPLLALDTGHCLVTGERDPAAALREYASRLGTVSIEDMRHGEHLHRPFGTGDMDMHSVLAALRDIDFRGLACVELSRESPRADRAIPEAISWLRACEAALPSPGVSAGALPSLAPAAE